MPTLAPMPATHPAVLIVDDSRESREVLRWALEMRGLQALEARGLGQGLDLLRRHKPQVVVLNVEPGPGTEGELRGAFAAATQDHATPVILIGGSRAATPEIPEDRFVAKPYHYGPLVRKIEQLCDQASAAAAG